MAGDVHPYLVHVGVGSRRQTDALVRFQDLSVPIPVTEVLIGDAEVGDVLGTAGVRDLPPQTLR